MSHLRFLWINIIETLLRVLPFPCETGLVKVGSPDRDSPVLLTGNFRLTVERLKRRLEGIDAYLLVANSRGVNVWCAATGGLLTNHDVVSVLKTSGIGALVDHRKVILPQLAATGIEGKVVREKTGWRVEWGPVDAAEIPAFLARGRETTREMRTVSFRWPQRLEMAIAWAFPISLLAVLTIPLWRWGALGLVGLVWGLSLLIFLGFPLYQGRLRRRATRVGVVVFDLGERAIPLVIWLLFVAGLVVYSVVAGEPSWGFIARWAVSALVVVAILGLDLTGSTPVYKSGLHADRLLRIALDEERCKGAGFCQQVCPKRVFELDDARRIATLPRAEECVQCGACVVQCPFDALHFAGSAGEVLMPDTVRRFKLNLMGRRAVDATEDRELSA
ncbi:MAG: HgcAB-like fusion protein [Myxococcota bacterium]